MPIRQSKAYLKFTREFDDARSNDFQSWVADLLSARHGAGDFIRIRGTPGDHGLDGHVISLRRAYQCFAPRNPSDGDMSKKISENFETARTWLETRGGMAEWIFIYGDIDGAMGAESAGALNKLKSEYPSMVIQAWNRDRFWEEIYIHAPIDTLKHRFGSDVSRQDIIRLRVPEILNVLSSLQTRLLRHSPAVGGIPDMLKLDFNDFDRFTRDDIATGRLRTDLVEDIFAKSENIDKGQEIAESFRAKYQELAAQMMDPDTIYAELLKFCSISEAAKPVERAAIFTVLAYFFDRCDIFKNPPESLTV
ncbi:MAG: hypothetical protein HS117_01605 [Verrucomicrobiaceae bacterium]|nr:hypothetical protein [Verrucomicrobiaceae bacterium]